MVPDSRTSRIGNIEFTSNVDTTGRWMFRIDQATIVDNSCLDSYIGISVYFFNISFILKQHTFSVESRE